MKKVKLMLIVVFGLFWIQCGSRIIRPSAASAPMLMMGGTEFGSMSFDGLVDQLHEADAVFIGEIHDDSLTHVMEFELLKALHNRFPHFAVSLEMFERDVQSHLNDYLHGIITEEMFLKKSRPWKNYTKAYRPLVEFARENSLPVLAMNVPRHYAGQLAMRGKLDINSLPDSEKVWVARELKVPDGEYKDRFIKVLEDPEQPEAMSRINPENLYRAQCLKDDTMAESIHAFLQKHPDYKIVSYQGDFHSAFGLGIVEKLKLLNPSIQTVVVSIVPVEDYPPEDVSDYKGQGDFLIFVQRFEQK